MTGAGHGGLSKPSVSLVRHTVGANVKQGILGVHRVPRVSCTSYYAQLSNKQY